jgi:rhodanese-related sulfurtransferase
MHDPVFSKGDRLALFCASGGRWALSAKILVDMGFEDICHIAGGMAAWAEAGGPSE